MASWIASLYANHRFCPHEESVPEATSQKEILMYTMLAHELDPSEVDSFDVNDAKKGLIQAEVLEKIESWVNLHPVELEG